MQVRRFKASLEPILLLDPEADSAAELAGDLELRGFAIHVEHTEAGARAAMKDASFAVVIVVADVNHDACPYRLDDLRRAALRSWMIVISPRCDAKTCERIYRRGGDACLAAPVSIDDLIGRLTAFQARSRPLY